MMRIWYGLLIVVPIALILEFGGIGGHTSVFVASALACRSRHS